MPVEPSPWSGAVAVWLALLVAFGVGVATMLVVRRLQPERYPDPRTVFPPLSVEDMEQTLLERTDDLAVCTNCRVAVPQRVSTGSCPVCASSVAYVDVRDDDDVALVMAAIR